MAKDQAATLRGLQEGTLVPMHLHRDRAIAITGGKGGVGKSTLAVNLAVTYAKQGAKTLAVDADLGMADLNLLLGVAPKNSLLDVIQGKDPREVLIEAHGIHLLPALNGSQQLANMDDITRHRVFEAIEGMDDQFDTLVVDVAAGIGTNQTSFAGAVQDVLVVATSEPLSLADAYACIKALSMRCDLQRAFIVPNRVRNAAEADEVVGRLSSLVNRFLDVQLVALPHIPYDHMISDAAASGVPLVLSHPDSPASRAIRQLARRLDSQSVPDERDGVVRLFWRNTFGTERGA